MLRQNFRLMVLLRVDLMNAIGLIIVSGYHSTQKMYELDIFFGLDMAILFGSILFTVVGYFAHKRESIPLILSFWTLSAVVYVYIGFIYYIIILHVKFDTLLGLTAPNHQNRETVITATLFIIVSILFFICRITLMVTSVYVCQNFGKGVPQIDPLSKSPQPPLRLKTRENSYDYNSMTYDPSIAFNATDTTDDELAVEDVLHHTEVLIQKAESRASNPGSYQHTPEDWSSVYGKEVK